MSDNEEPAKDGNVQQNGFKNLMCPLCLNVMYKSTTTACGHSFCERCLDEYLIIRKVNYFAFKSFYSNASFVMSK